MKNRLVALLGGMLASCLLTQPASAHTSARDAILIYNQYGTWSEKPLSNDRTLKSSGCQIYSYAHAIQWLSGEKQASSSGGNLLQTLIDIDNDPSDKYQGGGSAQERYHNYIVNTLEIAEPVLIPYSVTEYETLFHNGGITISNPGGHYVIAVGYTYCDVTDDGKPEMLIHVIDSSMGSTIRRRQDGSVFSFGTFKVIPQSSYKSYWRGGQYWITYEEFIAFRQDRAYIPKLSVDNTVGTDNNACACLRYLRLQIIIFIYLSFVFIFLYKKRKKAIILQH